MSYTGVIELKKGRFSSPKYIGNWKFDTYNSFIVIICREQAYLFPIDGLIL